MDRKRLADYLLHDGVASVEGWLSDGAISATLLFDDWQRKHGITGNVAEIGVHHGRYFILLANLRAPGEQAIAVDVFENQELNVDQSGRGNYRVFTSHLAHFTDNERIHILKRDSKSLVPADIIQPGKTRIRLFSVDGAHTAAYSLSDLLLAENCLVDGGIVILDDFYNPDWPGVQEGFFDFIRRRTAGIVPFAYGNNKMFLCHRPHAAALNAYIKENLGQFLLRRKDTEIARQKVVHVNFRRPAEIFDEDLSPAANMFLLKAGFQSSRCRLTGGWAAPQHNGVWTVGAEASLELDLANLDEAQDESDVTLAVSAFPLLHGARKRRGLRVFVDDHEIAAITADNPAMHGYKIDLPPALLANPLKLKFLIEAPEAPARVLGSSDRRPLGFFVESVRLSRHHRKADREAAD